MKREPAELREILDTVGEEHRGAAGGEAEEEKGDGGDHVRPRKQRTMGHTTWRGRDGLLEGNLTSEKADKVTIERPTATSANGDMSTAEAEAEGPHQRPPQGLGSVQGYDMAQPRIDEADDTTACEQPGEGRLLAVVGHEVGDQVCDTDCNAAPSLRRCGNDDGREAAEHDRTETHDEDRKRSKWRGAGTADVSSARRGGGRRVVSGSGGSAARGGAWPQSSSRGG